ncbi:DNA polymerase IV [Shouchella lonarensis]|uniref:DNA polymerase IV n=1 Tax=Shouchella lonarensis TaxID=1464122 RepID=A0A1G6HF68_9BACI|nr:DNA polymerase IV [Shouchella lonarensis]SDB92804.1 DNA polymerase-4 [Shouchella lonarensis]
MSTFSRVIELPEPRNDESRKIIHIDMDAFFSSVEERERPSLRGKPVIIAKHPRKTGGKGIVSTANYIARQYGVRSAMSAYEAYQRCPEGIFIEGNYAAYQKASAQIQSIMKRYTDMIEPMSIDEAYLDVTENKHACCATQIAQHIQRAIWRELQLSSSAGVSYNKFLAKIASDMKKPSGLTVVPPTKAMAFIHSLKVEKFPGVGPKTAAKMHDLHIYTGADLYAMEQLDLIYHFGKAGVTYYRRVRGIDHRPVCIHRERQSVGKEHTYPRALVAEGEVREALKKLCQEVHVALGRVRKKGKTVVLKVRYRSFETYTKRVSVAEGMDDKLLMFRYVCELWEEIGQLSEGVRLLGVTVTNLMCVEEEPLSLFSCLSHMRA